MSSSMYIVIGIVIALLLIIPSVRIVWQYEKGLVFRFGKLRGERSPG